MAEKPLANGFGRACFGMVVRTPQIWLSATPRWMEIGLVLLLAWVIAGWWVGSEDTPKAAFTTLPKSIKASTVQDEDWLDAPLFGKQEVKVVAPKLAVAKPVVVSRLNLKLLGTVVAGERSAAVVIVGGSNKQQVFFLGDMIQPSVSLDKVEVDAIVVNNHGKSERVALPKGKSLLLVGHAALPTVRPNTVLHTLQRSALNRQVRNFPKLLSQARVVPHFSQGKSDGFVIGEIVPNSLYQQIGLKNGDVIRKVNGQAVTNAEQAMQMYQALQNASAIDLELERNGSILPIHYVIQ